MISYEKAQHLKSLINTSYKYMNGEDYDKIEIILKEINRKKIDDIFKKALKK